MKLQSDLEVMLLPWIDTCLPNVLGAVCHTGSHHLSVTDVG